MKLCLILFLHVSSRTCFPSVGNHFELKCSLYNFLLTFFNVPQKNIPDKMTFKKDFKQQMVPEWEKEYMDYEGLKKISKEIKSRKQATNNNRSLRHTLRLERAFSGIHLHGSNHHSECDIEDQVIEVKTLEEDGSKPSYKTDFQKRDEEGGEAEARLFEKLDEELNKVNAFYKNQVEAAEHESTLLSKQVEALVALRVKVKNPVSGKCKIQVYSFVQYLVLHQHILAQVIAACTH